MADDVEMTPVEAAEPPKANPLEQVSPKVATIKLNPIARKPAGGGTPTAALKPGLKLPPKPGMATGLKLPPKPGMAAGLKLPPKPATTTATLKPGMKLPTVALKPGIKLPPKPVIRKPGATVTAAPLPKPIVPQTAKPTEASAVAPSPAPVAASVPPSPAPVPPSPAPVAAPKPVAVDAQGVGKLPTVEAKAVDRADTAPTVSANPNALEALKSVTQKLKGITQEIPQQAILRKTGIIAEGAMSEAQKEAAKHKTARISLSDAMGVAPVKNENAPMKTIRIKRPIDIAGATKSMAPAPAPVATSAAETVADLPAPAAVPAAPAETSAEAPAATVTQRKTLKIARPGGAVRPAGKFGIKRPSQATTIAKAPAADGAPATPEAVGDAPVADIADIPEMPAAPRPVAAASEGPAWLTTLSTVVQAAACVAIGALAWFLYQNTQIAYF